MLDKLFKYIADHKIQLNEDSWESCINGFLNDKKCRRHYNKISDYPDKYEDTRSHNIDKFNRYINKLFRSGEIIYMSGDIMFNGTGCIDKLGFDWLTITHRNYKFTYNPHNSDPIEFINRLKWLICNYDKIHHDAKIRSFNLFHENDIPAIAITNDGELKLVEPLENASPAMESMLNKIFDKINGR